METYKKRQTSLGEQSAKMISQKYRDIHPSFMGKIDINVSSNSDVGMSGAFTPFVELYDNFYFSPDREPYNAGYELHNIQLEHIASTDDTDTFEFSHSMNFENIEDYLEFINEHDNSFDGLKYEKIEIVEKETDNKVEKISLKIKEKPEEIEEDTDENDSEEE